MITCAWCTEAIFDEDLNTMHIHHDLISCSWLPPIFDPALHATDEDYLEAVMEALAVHELTCEINLHYHEKCCRKCAQDFAGV